MKSLAIALCVILTLFSCKKQSGGSTDPELLLSDVSKGGLLEYRFLYNGDNLVTKLEYYPADPTDNSLSGYVNFLYNAQKNIQQLVVYQMPNNVPGNKVTIQYDSAGRLVSASTFELQGPSPNTAQYTTSYTYNTKGLVIKIVQKNKSNELVFQNNLAYYDEGQLKEKQEWVAEGGQLWMKRKTSYSSPNGYYATGLEQLRVLISADFMAAMHSDAISFLDYSQAGVIVKSRSEIMSAREYNPDGSLKKQVITYKYIKPEDDDKVYVREYKYLNQ